MSASSSTRSGLIDTASERTGWFISELDAIPVDTIAPPLLEADEQVTILEMSHYYSKALSEAGTTSTRVSSWVGEHPSKASGLLVVHSVICVPKLDIFTLPRSSD